MLFGVSACAPEEDYDFLREIGLASAKVLEDKFSLDEEQSDRRLRIRQGNEVIRMHLSRLRRGSSIKESTIIHSHKGMISSYQTGSCEIGDEAYYWGEELVIFRTGPFVCTLVFDRKGLGPPPKRVVNLQKLAKAIVKELKSLAKRHSSKFRFTSITVPDEPLDIAKKHFKTAIAVNVSDSLQGKISIHSQTQSRLNTVCAGHTVHVQADGGTKNGKHMVTISAINETLDIIEQKVAVTVIVPPPVVKEKLPQLDREEMKAVIEELNQINFPNREDAIEFIKERARAKSRGETIRRIEKKPKTGTRTLLSEAQLEDLTERATQMGLTGRPRQKFMRQEIAKLYEAAETHRLDEKPNSQ